MRMCRNKLYKLNEKGQVGRTVRASALGVCRAMPLLTAAEF